ncbi:MAG TPA: FeoA family protein [Labilithrix sp.]|nr:FeoA family protein [Labilithrix sp.]
MVDAVTGSLVNGDAHPLRLADAAVGARVRIVGAKLERELAAWLSAVGLDEGEEVVVLRRAALGGPLHVRTSSGGEFAVAKELAALIDVVVTADEAAR